MDLAIKETIWGRLYNGGQVCCASKRFLIHNSRKQEFIDRMKEVISTLKVGDPMKEAIEIANQSSYGLCGCVFTRDYSRGIKISHNLECGGAVINGASFYRSFEMPFGGWKHSGIGNEGVSSTLEEMSQLKTIV